jgi:hypothetical protein
LCHNNILVFQTLGFLLRQPKNGIPSEHTARDLQEMSRARVALGSAKPIKNHGAKNPEEKQ